jgi:hypothetical protein
VDVPRKAVAAALDIEATTLAVASTLFGVLVLFGKLHSFSF